VQPSVPPPPIPPAPAPGRPDVDGQAGAPRTEEAGSPSTARWRPWEIVPVFLIGLVVGIVLAVPVGAFTDSRSVLFVAATGLGEIGFGLAVLFWVKLVSHAKLSALGVSASPIRDVGAGLVGGAILTAVALFASVVVVAIVTAITGHSPHQPDQIPTYVTGASFAVSGALVVLAAPFGEELLFRGFLYNSLRRSWTTWPSALLSGALFALLHGAPILILAIFPVGVGLALIYEWRHSIFASMAAHATFNLIGFITIFVGRR
jgi:uncharacterized protein